MDPERWKQVDELLQSALRLPSGERPAFLHQACNGDSALERDVQSLFTHQREIDGFLERPAFELAAEQLAARESSRLLIFDVQAGQSISQYRVLERIGAGGMGVVYKAEDTKLGRMVALKFLPNTRQSDSQALERFQREARTASALNHPNICTIYDISEYQRHPFISMEYLDGRTLKDHIARQTLDTEEISKLGIQIADALWAAHSKGIIHRDIKPGNIMVTASGPLKVLDFGLAKLMGPESESAPAHSLTETHTVTGTLPYMSPEQLRGRVVDGRTDIYALGVVLCEMATGRRPFAADTSAQLIDDILNTPPPSPRLVNPKISPKLEEIILKCLEKDPEMRFQSAADLRTDLKRLHRDTTSGHRLAHTSAINSATQTKKARSWAWITAGAVLTVVAVTAWLYLPILARHSGPPPRLLPFTSFGGDKGWPAFSPDGNTLAYTWQGENPTNGVYHVYVQLVGTSTPLQLTKAAMRDDSPAWSPDGRFVAFCRHPAGGTIDSDSGAYYIVPALGGPERKLAEGYQEFGVGGLSWSPDGKYLSIVDRGTQPDPNARAQLFFVSTESGERRNSGIILPAPFAASPAFSPDGKWLAFSSGVRPSSSDVYLVSVQGGKPRPLTSVNALINGVAWTPDGRQLVFDADHLGLSTLWRVPVSGGAIEPVAGTTDYAVQPTVSLRGDRLAFQRYHVDTNVWRIPLSHAESEPPRKLIESTAEDSLPAYSPDAKSIAFASSRSGSYEIYVSAADGSNPAALTSLKTFSSAPAWSPDGKQIAFNSRSAGQSHIFIIGAEGGSPRRVTNGPHSNASPSWSHDGRWIYFTSNRSGTDQVWKVRSNGEDPVQVTVNGGLRPIESPDGKFLYYYRSGAVWRGDPNSKTERRLLATAHYQYYGLCGKDLCAIDRPSGSAGRFIRCDPVTGRQQVKPLDIGFQTDASTGMDVSPDGRWLLYTRTDAIQSDIMMVENFH